MAPIGVVPGAASPFAADGVGGTPLAWGGLSGALVFCNGLALGVVVEHHRRQGASALRLVPFNAIAAASDPDTRWLAEALGVPGPEALIPAGYGAVTDIVATTPAPAVPTLLPGDDVDLKGRDAECTEIVRQMGLRGPGAPAMVLISGTPGVGKS
jgi:hypothetical protein